MDKEMQTCNMDERTNEEKLLDQISELQNEVSANKIFKASDEKLIERLIAETADKNARVANLEKWLRELIVDVSIEDFANLDIETTLDAYGLPAIREQD